MQCSAGAHSVREGDGRPAGAPPCFTLFKLNKLQEASIRKSKHQGQHPSTSSSPQPFFSFPICMPSLLARFFPPLIHTMICTVNLSREKKILRKEQNPTTRNHVGNAERTGRQEEAPHQFIHQLASSPVPRNAMQEPRPSSVACSSTDYS